MQQTFDPVMLEVMNNELGAIGDEMAFTMRRTARSFAGREGGDFMVGLLDVDGNLIARSQYAIDKWNIVTAMPSVWRNFPGGLRNGDIFISNDPYGGGDHLNDMTLIMPIYREDQLVGYAGNCLHATDVGGRPGGMSAYAQSVYEEGVRLPGVLLHEAGVENRALLEILRANSRAPDDLLGDLEAQIVALRRGEEGYLRLIRKYGLKNVVSFTRHLMDYTERQVREKIGALPEGEWVSEEQLEDDGTGNRPGPLLVERLRIKDRSITIDYTGSSPQARNAINRPPGLNPTRGSEIVRHVLGLDMPMNSGVLRCIKVIAPEGTVANPRFPGAVGARAYLRGDGLTAAFAMAVPDRMPAGGTGVPGIMLFTFDEGGSPRVLFDVYQNGSGGRPTKDGIDGGGSRATGGAGVSETPVEVIEREHPVIVEAFGFAPDTGGAGKFRGAVAVFRRWQFRRAGRVNIRYYNYQKAAYGLNGGSQGTTAGITLRREGKLVDLPAQSHLEFEVRPGDILMHIQAGPGGHGNPWERDPQRVLEDVLDEKLTIGYVERHYGVAIDPQLLQVDKARTARLRQERGPLESKGDNSAVVVRRVS